MVFAKMSDTMEAVRMPMSLQTVVRVRASSFSFFASSGLSKMLYITFTYEHPAIMPTHTISPKQTYTFFKNKN